METKSENMETGSNVISSYSQTQAIEDGILVIVGRLTTGQRVVFTHNLFESGGYEDPMKRIQLINNGISLLKQLDIEDTDTLKLRVIEKNRIWVIADGNGLTFLRPEDY